MSEEFKTKSSPAIRPTDSRKNQRGFILLVFLLAMFLGTFHSLNESDNFYHLKTGQIIWQTKHIPTADIFSYTAPGAPWVPQEWLSQIIFYGIYSIAGFWGLVSFVSLVATLSYWLLFKVCSDLESGFWQSLLSITLTATLIFPLWTARPQIFAFLCFVLLLWLIQKYLKHAKPKFLIFIVLTIWLWANLHASFILGLGVLAIFALGCCLMHRFPHAFGHTSLNLRQIYYLLISVAVSVALSLVNPSGYHIYIYTLLIGPVVQTFHFFEWQPLLTYWSELNVKLVTLAIILFGSFGLYWFGLRPKSRNLVWSILILIFSVMPFVAIRHNGFWSILIALPLSLALTQASKKLENIRPYADSAVLIILLLSLVYSLSNLPSDYYNSYFVPVQAADFIESQHIKGPLFNFVNEGGYLLWRFYPNEKVSIDSRAEVYVGQPTKDFEDITRGASNWDYLVDQKYHINYFIFSYHTSISGQAARKTSQTLIQKGWPLIYWDDNSMIFVRPSADNQNLITKFAMRHVSPYRDPRSIGPSEINTALSEINHLIQTAPASGAPQIYRQALLKQQSSFSSDPAIPNLLNK